MAGPRDHLLPGPGESSRQRVNGGVTLESPRARCESFVALRWAAGPVTRTWRSVPTALLDGDGGLFLPRIGSRGADPATWFAASPSTSGRLGTLRVDQRPGRSWGCGFSCAGRRQRGGVPRRVPGRRGGRTPRSGTCSGPRWSRSAPVRRSEFDGRAWPRGLVRMLCRALLDRPNGMRESFGDDRRSNARWRAARSPGAPAARPPAGSAAAPATPLHRPVAPREYRGAGGWPECHRGPPNSDLGARSPSVLPGPHVHQSVGHDATERAGGPVLLEFERGQGRCARSVWPGNGKGPRQQMPAGPLRPRGARRPVDPPAQGKIMRSPSV